MANKAKSNKSNKGKAQDPRSDAAILAAVKAGQKMMTYMKANGLKSLPAGSWYRAELTLNPSLKVAKTKASLTKALKTSRLPRVAVFADMTPAQVRKLVGELPYNGRGRKYDRAAA